MKRSILIAILICALLTSAVSAAFFSPNFQGGMISGIYLDGSTLYAADIQNKVIWRVSDGKTEVFAGNRTYRDINDIVIGSYLDAKASEARFMEPWAIVPFLDGWAVSDASANAVRFIIDDQVKTAAGNTESGFIDGFCTDARLYRPTGLAVNDSGDALSP